MKSKIIYLLLFMTFYQIVLAEENDLYNYLWLDQDKKVFVLQNKQFKKKYTVYGDLGYLTGISSPFQSVSGFYFKSGFYFTEVFAIDLFYNSYSNTNNSSYKSMEYVNGTVPFVRRMNAIYGAQLIWSPFYGKINTFNEIFYFDWSFGLGLAHIDSESNVKNVSDTNAAVNYEKEKYLGVIMSTSIRFHITKRIHIGISAFNTLFSSYGPDRSSGKTMSNNLDFMFFVGGAY